MQSLSEVNDYFFRHFLWPAMLYTLVMMLFGLLGNGLVLIVYRGHFRNSVTRMFIYSLALLDMANCLITMPSELIVLAQFASFPSAVWCKISRYLTYTFNGSSSILLIGIALDRYNKVCHPNRAFITVKRARIICVGALVFSLVLSLPALFIYGDMTLMLRVQQDGIDFLRWEQFNQSMPLASDETTPPGNHTNSSSALYLKANLCLVSSDYLDTNYPTAFYISLFALYLTMVVAVIFSYTQLVRAMYYLRRRHTRMFSLFQFYRASNSALPDPNERDQPEDEKEQGGSSKQGGNRDQSGSTPKAIQNSFHQDQIKFNGDTAAFHAHRVDIGEILGDAERLPLGVSRSLDQLDQSLSQGRLTPQQAGSSRGLEAREDEGENALQGRECGGETHLEPGVNAKERSLVKQTDSGRGSQTNVSQGKTEPLKEGNGAGSSPSSNTSPAHKSATAAGQGYTGHVPKVKVHKAKKAEGRRDLHHPGLPCENSLLMRRIHSTENVRGGAVTQPAISLSQLDIGGLAHSFSSKTKPSAPRRRRDWSSLDALRPVTLNMGGQNLAGDVMVIDGAAGRDRWSPGDTEAKTLTLTRISPKSSKRLCVLPLTGLSSKTAVQVLERADRSATGGGGDGGDGRPRSNVSFREDDASAVTMRATSPEEMHRKTPQSDLKTPAGLTPRREVVSTAEILKEQHEGKALQPFRTSTMLLIISLVFVVSFCPFFIIALVRSVQGSSFTDQLSEAEIAIVSIFIRSSLISNAVNPLVYGFLSAHFRRECKALICYLFTGGSKKK